MNEFAQQYETNRDTDTMNGLNPFPHKMRATDPRILNWGIP